MSGQRVELRTGETRWHVDAEFLQSKWSCSWGRGCQGIEASPAPAAGLGCCSMGAEVDPDEALNVAALALTLDPARFQYHHRASEVFSDEGRTNSAVVDGACVFLNRPGFDGGAGCALHLAALDAGESPVDWKPSVCWQLPLRIDWSVAADGVEEAVLRRWTRQDWGPEGETMAWCCTEAPENYDGTAPVVESLAEELTMLLGTDGYRQLRAALEADPGPQRSG